MALLLGGIVMWSGAIEEIPDGWALCDGQNDTLDLRNRFVLCAGNSYAVGVTGGSADSVNIAHTHTGSTNSAGSHNHTMGHCSTGGGNIAQGGTDASGGAGTNSAGNHSHTITVTSAGESGVGKNLPPYYALAFIQQIV